MPISCTIVLCSVRAGECVKAVVAVVNKLSVTANGARCSFARDLSER